MTYPRILQDGLLEKTIIKDYAQWGDNVFANSYAFFDKYAMEYCPVLNMDGVLDCFAYNERGAADQILDNLWHWSKMKNPEGVLMGYSEARIYGINEIGFRIAKQLKESNSIKLSVIGKDWEKLRYEDIAIENGFDENNTGKVLLLRVEGNYGIPIEEMGLWRHDFPHYEYAEWERLTGAMLFGKDTYDNWLEAKEAQQYLFNKITNGEPFAATRLGKTESIIVGEYMKNEKYDDETLKWLYSTSGFFSENEINERDVDRYAEATINAVRETDMHMVVFKENIEVVNAYMSAQAAVCRWYGGGIYDGTESDVVWTDALKGKKILVISPYARTVETQYEKREKIYCDRHRLPEFELITYQMISTQMGEHCGFRDFFDAYEKVKADIRQIDFDIALIAAGAYGYLLSCDIKEMGKQAIELCSYLMPFFGIKTKRHVVQEYINRYYNEYWSFPIDEPPPYAQQVENGAYW